MATPLERQTPPHRNRPVAVFAAPEQPVVVVEISRDPGGKYGEGFNESNYFRVVHVGAKMRFRCSRCRYQK